VHLANENLVSSKGAPRKIKGGKTHVMWEVWKEDEEEGEEEGREKEEEVGPI
jgi:hypothetical protein